MRIISRLSIILFIFLLVTSCEKFNFDEGDGTNSHPYIVNSIEQFQKIKDHPNSSFRLNSDIDLSNFEWQPFEFNGNLYGAGHVVSNLTIRSTQNSDGVGLFSSCEGTITDLIVANVDISAPNACNVGSISGSGGTITNCKVYFGNGSLLIGNQRVGGICGSNAIISNCTVESNSKGDVIKGESMVGGIVGYLGCKSIQGCTTRVSIKGTNYVGGIVGYVENDYFYNEQDIFVTNCAFEGTITCYLNVGGIIGFYRYGSYTGYYTEVFCEGCKAIADIVSTGNDGHAGGIIGSMDRSYVTCYACYSDGSINAISAGGISGDGGSAYLCYSTMTSNSSYYYGMGRTINYCQDCATTSTNINKYDCQNCKTSCTDITTFLQECYSEYADLYNFNNTWTWEGNIEGNNVKVSCPKLAWEN